MKQPWIDNRLAELESLDREGMPWAMDSGLRSELEFLREHVERRAAATAAVENGDGDEQSDKTNPETFQETFQTPACASAAT